MNEWAIILIVAILFLLFILALFSVLFRPQHVKSETFEDANSLKDIVETYAEDSHFRIHHMSDLEKPYCEITYVISYKRLFRNLHQLEEVSREVIHIDYYIKL